MVEAEKTAKYKSKKFAIRIINMYKYLCEDKKEYVLSKQVLRSGTSIGANLTEAGSAMSKRDFLAKVYIALKECSETIYWLEILNETEYITDKMFHSMYSDCDELRKCCPRRPKPSAPLFTLHSPN